ncbi:MAG: TATA-box-binding protein [Euryarchaeota archaeon]|nr:TATA-box-binding protein [Euryarchaeota archaeon]
MEKPEKPKAIINIENVVASASLNRELDLEKVAEALENIEYEPEQFPGLVYRLKEPKTAALIFRSGKIVCTGAKSIDEVHQSIAQTVEKMKKHGIDVSHGVDIQVQNIVSSADLNAELNLDAIAVGLGLENVEYEPEQFPGLVYRLKEPKVVILLFGSGKLVCTGAKDPKDAEIAVAKVTEELKRLGLMGEPRHA